MAPLYGVIIVALVFCPISANGLFVSIVSRLTRLQSLVTGLATDHQLVAWSAIVYNLTRKISSVA